MSNNIVEDLEGPEGCYLTFEPSSGGRLMLIYSKGQIPSNAIGFWYVVICFFCLFFTRVTVHLLTYSFILYRHLNF